MKPIKDLMEYEIKERVRKGEYDLDDRNNFFLCKYVSYKPKKLNNAETH